MEQSTELRDFVLSSYQARQRGTAVDFWERHLSQQDGVLVIGTDPDEWWLGYTAILEMAKSGDGGLEVSTIESDPQAYAEGTVGWFADNFEWKLPNGAAIAARLTGVCHKEDGDWKIVQMHVSIGIPNEEAFG